MQIIVIAGFVVAMSLMGLSDPWVALPWPAVLACIVGYVGSVYAAARVGASIGLRRLMRGNGQGRLPVRLMAITQVYMVVGLGALMLVGWANLITRMLPAGTVPLVDKALAVAPFIAALMAFWWATYPMNRAMRQQNIRSTAMAGDPVRVMWTRRQFLIFNIRCNLLLVAVPVGLIILVLDLLYLAEPAIGTDIAASAALLAIGGIFLSAPAIIVRIWKTRPLPAGPLRSRLEQLSKRAGFACRNILIWDTGSVIVNAAVLGVVRPVRYVLMSDAMLEHFDADDVVAVFAHEAGHVVHRHIPYMIIFSVALILLMSWIVEFFAARFDIAIPIVELLAVLVMGTLWLWLFGMLSRRFERQADVFAAATATGEIGAELSAEGVSLFSGALMKVALMNGISPSQRNFRHGSITHRLAYLDRLHRSGTGRASVDRSVRLIKIAIWLLAIISIAVTIVSQI
ncbi:MAG: M48 family metalloprotease [Phycisphaerae bacterium]|nr:M48 family metalloprotease [Phycisphaerae bacterium]